jgi:NADPH:quinone reductase-like Zn-dependent oxidoreductase
MRSYHLGELGSLEALGVRDDTSRPLTPGEVRVGMRAASLNYRDLLIILDQVPGGGTKEDVIPLSDGAGEVLEIGEGVEHVAVGDRVVAVFNSCWLDGAVKPGYLDAALGGARDGTLTEEMVLRSEDVLPLPDQLSFEEGAAHGCASVSAWSSLVGGRPLTAGQTVLVQGTGGVSMFALQYAKAAGARVIATTSSKSKAEKLRDLGADHVVNYVERPEWQDDVRRATDGLGVDRVVEVGGPGTIQRSVASTIVGGHVAIVGFAGGAEGALNPLALMGKGITLEGIAVGSRRHFSDSLQLTQLAGLHPVLDEVFRFEDADRAYRHLLERRHVGKVIIRIG